MSNRNLVYIALGLGAAYLLIREGVSGMNHQAIFTMADAIKLFEGWGPGSVSFRNNNPGNLKFRNQPGAVGQDEQGHAIFESYSAGWEALVKQITSMFNGTSHIYNPSMTLRQVFSKYAEANSNEYAQYVAFKLNVTPDTTLEEIWTAQV